MADKYLVPCNCGHTLRVGVHQAGSPLTCQCGGQVIVPPLRKLRELPREAGEDTLNSGAWSPRHAAVFGGVVLTLLLLAWGGWRHLNDPPMPKFEELRKQQLSHRTDTILENAPPVEFWKAWISMEPELSSHGFEDIPDPQQEAWVKYFENRHWQRNLILVASGVTALATLAVWLVGLRSRRPV